MDSRLFCGWGAVIACAVGLLAPRAALAETYLVPVGGRSVTLGPDRTVCPDSVPTGPWVMEADGHAMRPPSGDAAIGQVVTVRVALAPTRCAPDSPEVTFVAISRAPSIDPASVVADVDAARVVVRGRGLRGAVLRWRAGERAGEDVCTSPETTPAGDACTFALARGLPADPQQLQLAVLPAGVRAGDAVLFDPTGRRVAPEEYAIRVAQVVVGQLLPPDAAVDESSGVGHVTLVHPEAVAAVECGDAACDVEGSDLVVRGEHGGDDALDVHVHLRPHVVYQHGTMTESNTLLDVPLQRCPVAVASAAPLRGVADQRVVVRVGGRCAHDPGLEFTTPSGAAPMERAEHLGGDLYAVVRVARVDGDELPVTVRRDGTVVGVARARSRRLPSLHARLELPGRGAIDFIPTNREARVLLPALDGVALVPAAVEGVYTLRRDAQGGDLVQGVAGAAGSVALRVAYVDRGLPAPLRDLELAEVSEAVDRTLRVANVPVDLAASVADREPLAELVCGDGGGRAAPVRTGTTTSIPYRARETCRLVLHRERLRLEDGAQTLQLAVDVIAADGSTRSEAAINRRITLRAQPEPLLLYLRGAQAPFDRYSVRLALADEGDHYAVGADEQFGAVQAQWSVVNGTERARLYGTTAIPTGLFRLADTGHSGILTLNAGALLRLVWLSREGSESPIGLEGGLMWLGIAGDTDPAAAHGQVAVVAGIGVSVPIANASRASQTSINLHAWFEYEVSRAVVSQPGTPIGFVFGPSISIGDVGANF